MNTDQALICIYGHAENMVNRRSSARVVLVNFNTMTSIKHEHSTQKGFIHSYTGKAQEGGTLTLVLNHTICSDQWRDLTPDVGNIDLTPSGNFVIFDYLNLMNNKIKIVRHC